MTGWASCRETFFHFSDPWPLFWANIQSSQSIQRTTISSAIKGMGAVWSMLLESFMEIVLLLTKLLKVKIFYFIWIWAVYNASITLKWVACHIVPIYTTCYMQMELSNNERFLQLRQTKYFISELFSFWFPDPFCLQILQRFYCLCAVP